VPSRAFWQLGTFLLNGTLFVLVGLQLRGAVRNLVSSSIPEAVVAALLVIAMVVGVRLLWMYTIPYLIQLVDRRQSQRVHRIGARQRLPLAWCGFRGAASLAAALAVPVTVADGSPFPGRDLIILVAFGVILVTLLVQGLTLPAILRWAQLPTDHGEAAERQLAERTAIEAALAALPDVATRLNASEEAADRLRAELEERLADLAEPSDDATGEPAPGALSVREDYRRLHHAVLADKRAALVKLRDAHLIDDIVLRRVQARLDAEDMRLSGALEAESE
jgi:CPA1 family monovalent cation:H+ antiporter